MRKLFIYLSFLVIISSCKDVNLIMTRPFPVQIDKHKVYAFDTLVITYQNLTMRLNKGKMMTIDTELGPTGLIILSSGTFNYFNTSIKQNTADTIQSLALMRFNPEEFDKVVNLKQFRPTTDARACEKAWKVFGAYFRHNYHSSYEALLPPKGNFSVVIDGKVTGYMDYSYDFEKDENTIFAVRRLIL